MIQWLYKLNQVFHVTDTQISLQEFGDAQCILGRQGSGENLGTAYTYQTSRCQDLVASFVCLSGTASHCPSAPLGGGVAEYLHQIMWYLNNSFVLLDAYNSEFNLNNIIGNPRSVINNLYRFDWLLHTFEMEFHHLLVHIDLYKTSFSYSKIFIFILNYFSNF